MIGSGGDAVRGGAAGAPQIRRNCEPASGIFAPYPAFRPMPFARLLVPLGAAALLAACGAPDPQRPAPGAASPQPLTVTTARIAEADSAIRFRAEVEYPQIEGGASPAVARVNRAIADSVRAIVEDIRPVPDEFTGDPELDRWVVGEVEGGFTEPLLREGLFSARLDLYVYTGGAHGNMLALPLNYDLDTGAPLALGDLFRPSAAYLDTLAARVTQRLTQSRGTGWMFEDALPPDPAYFAVFTLEADSLRFFFPPYAIAPYAVGPSEAALPYAALRAVLRADGPVARLAPLG